MANRNQTPEDQNQNQGKGNQGKGQNQNQGFQGQNQNQGWQNQNQQNPMQGQGQAQGQRQPQGQGQNIGQWEAWTQAEGSTTHLHVKGSFPADAKSQNFSLRQAPSQGTTKSQIILEIDNEGLNPQGRETATIREFDLPINSSQKIDSVVIKAKGNNVATVPVRLRDTKR